jgi:hypothetical protein
MAKLAMAPPVELIVNPVAAVLTVRVSEEAESVKAGAASAGVGAGATTGSGGGGGMAVVIEFEIGEDSEEPAAFIAFNVNAYEVE